MIQRERRGEERETERMKKKKIKRKDTRNLIGERIKQETNVSEGKKRNNVYTFREENGRGKVKKGSKRGRGRRGAQPGWVHWRGEGYRALAGCKRYKRCLDKGRREEV